MNQIIMLLSLIILPLIGCLIRRNWEIWISLLVWILSLFLWLNYSELVVEYGGIKFGIDGISLYLILLTTLLTFLIIMITKKEEEELRFWILLSESILIGVYSVLDILYFYILFEMTLIPLYYIIKQSMTTYKYRKRKVERAIKKLLGYTLLGSFIMLLGIILLYKLTGTTNLLVLRIIGPELEKEIEIQLLLKIIWISFFFAFAIKIPIMPFHIWLPEAHSEAPTGGSMLLAGIILKLGTYGILRYLLPILPNTTKICKPYAEILIIISIIYSVLIIIRQIEIKKLIAYSSISHMNLCLLGLFSGDFEGILGGYILMINHGLISGALFLSVGILLNRYSLRAIKYYRGLIVTMPLFSILFFFLNLSNIGFPPFASFLSEILIFTGSLKYSIITTFIASFSIIFSGVYGIWFITRIIFGKPHGGSVLFLNDLTKKEFLILSFNLLLSLLLGIFPSFLINDLTLPISLLL